MDLTLTVDSFEQDDQRWLASQHAADTGRTVTLDVSKFTKADHYPDGYLKSGIVITKLASGKYGPFDPSVVDGTSDGRSNKAGFLLEAVRVRASDATPAGSLLLHGVVDGARLPVTDTSKKGSVGVDAVISDPGQPDDGSPSSYAADLPHFVFV
jgi:hypothetical protein